VRTLFAAIAAALFLLGAGLARAQEKLPADFGSLDGYPVPIGAGSGAELDYCYRYSRRIWELVRGQPRTKAALDQVSGMAKQALGARGAAEDIAEFKKYFAGTYKTRDEMAGTRFFACAKHLKLPVEERHRRNSELCFGVLNLPSYVAALKDSGRTSEQALTTLKGANPASAHPGIEATVKLIYAKESDEEIDGLLKDTFLACLVKIGEAGAGK